ncbi:MAG: GlsB/YeaQ/YmgE family stress response membrane protein [Hyphomicrobiaceae bacterium]|nr:GlsB/YeaQ/YmgE family stress response membrane protein [Hyphomicrobiaceae bacterium]
MDERTKQLVVTAVIGIVAGWLASIVVGGAGIIQYLVSGVIGAFVGSFIISALGIKLRLGSAILEQILTAAIGAIVVVLLARIIA